MMNETPEQRSTTGKPMVAGTPRDVIHIRLASFVLFLAVALGVLALVAKATPLVIVLAVVAVIAIVDVVLAIRRQRRLGTGPRSTG
jgi:membrane protein YdbS with pleckstrin-like domain